MCFAATQLTLQLHLERTQVVYSNSEARKCPTELNGTQTVELGFEDIRIRRWAQIAYADGPKKLSLSQRACFRILQT